MSRYYSKHGWGVIYWGFLTFEGYHLFLLYFVMMLYFRYHTSLITVSFITCCVLWCRWKWWPAWASRSREYNFPPEYPCEPGRCCWEWRNGWEGRKREVYRLRGQLQQRGVEQPPSQGVPTPSTASIRQPYHSRRRTFQVINQRVFQCKC